MRQRYFITTCLLLVLAGTAIAKSNYPEQGATPPNIIVILADDQRADYLGCTGHPIVETPHIDRLAKKGVRFSNAFASSTSCTPNRTSIMTGQYKRKHGVTFGSKSSLSLEAFSKSYPMQLKKAGYYVGYVGKNHSRIGESSSGHGYKSGVMEQQFDYWYGNHGHSRFYPKERHPVYRNALADTQVEIFQEGAMNFLKANPEFDGTSEFLQTKPDDRPFCLMVNFNLPHVAGTGSMEQLPTDPELYRTAYRDRINEMPIPGTYISKNEIEAPKIPTHVYNGEYITSYNFVQTRESLRERILRTCQTVTGIDRLVGAVVAELEHQGIIDNTVIIYTSDHGLHFGEHGLGGKVLLYEESLQVPLIICDPRLPENRHGSVSEDLALSLDIAPTILELACLPISDEMQGQSLVPLMNSKYPSWRQDFFCENMYMGQNYPRIEGVRSKEFKYIRYFDKQKDQHHILSLTASIRGEVPIYEELYYDMRKDPGEERNLAESAEYQDVLERYRVRCRELVKEAKGGDDYPKTHILNDPRENKLTSQVQRSMDDLLRAKKIKDLQFGMFICWSFSTFSGQEWTPTLDKDATFFRATGCDTDQWCRVAKDAGMKYILFLTKHHDGFCLWDTETTDKKVTNSPLGIDVLAKLRESCDRYGIKLAFYFSEGDWNWPGALDGKNWKAGSSVNPEMKKAQLKELLTWYGPVEFFWMDHAAGEGGLSHKETVDWVHNFQPDCFVGFNHGEPAGRLCIRERGTPGKIGDSETSKYNKDAETSYPGYLVAEFTYPILPEHKGGAKWFYSLPEHDDLCKPAIDIYRDYMGALKYGNIFSLDVGPDYEGRIRKIDVKTLKKVGRYIRKSKRL